MAKISFNKLNLKPNISEKKVVFEGSEISVKSYLPVNEKLDLISRIINQSADDLKFYNVGKLEVFKVIFMIEYYTNIEFTDKQLENPGELYDILTTTGLANTIIGSIDLKEREFIERTLLDTVDSIYKYQNSVFGILDTITTDYDKLKFDTEELEKNISNPDNLKLLKDVVTKLG